ncbi:MAG: RodZ domain-containing protein [Nitrospirota bacterium]
MGTLGEDLKSTREQKGLTLGQIAEKTRISHTFLKALEEDDYNIIPGEVFITGFLRSYSKELGLNEKEVLARYRELRPQQREPQAPEAGEQAQHQPMPSLIRIGKGALSKKKTPVYIIILAGLLLGAALTGITLWLTPKEKPVAPPSGNAPQAAAVQAPKAVIFGHASTFPHASSTAPGVVSPPVSSSAGSDASPSPAPPEAKKGPVVLRLTAKEDSWYAYRQDKGRRVSGTLKEGDSVEIKAKNEIRLDIGNAGGVEAELNGKTLKAFGESGKPVKDIVITASGASVAAKE